MKLRAQPEYLNGRTDVDGAAAKLPEYLVVQAQEDLRKWESLRRHCLDDKSPHAVHRLRVTTRRLLAQLALLAPMLPREICGDARRALKKELKALSSLRDIHVQLQHTKSLLPTHAALKSFRAHLLRKKKRAERKAAHKLARPKYPRRIKRARTALAGAAAVLPPRAVEAFRASLRHTLDRAFADIVKLQHRAVAHPEWLHRMRIALKSYRYMAEALQPVLPHATTRRLRELQAYQHCTGEIHDLALLERRLAKYERRGTHPQLPACRKALARRRAMREQEQIALIPAALANHRVSRNADGGHWPAPRQLRTIKSQPLRSERDAVR